MRKKRLHIHKRPIYNLLGDCVGYEAIQKGIKIVECDKATADRIVEKYHYSHKATKNAFASLLVIYRGKVQGVLQCGYGIRPKIKGQYKPEQVREFDRMWLSDVMPKFSETIVLSLFHRYLRLAHPEVKVLISYADTSVGNKGAIYRASNYILVDRLKVDFYLLPNGERVHPVTMWHRHKTRAWETLQKLYPDIKHIRNGEQLKFVKYLK